MPTPAVDTHNMIMENGKHKGERVTRLPISYLKWMIKVRHSLADIAKAEMDRRGITTPELEVSIHAVDRASEFLLEDWRITRDEGQGFYSWLIELASLAIKKGTPKGDKILYRGVAFVFSNGDEVWPTLKTVTRTPKSKGKTDGPDGRE